MVDVAEMNLANEQKSKKTPSRSLTKEKIEEAKRKSLQIVESLLESSVSADFLIRVCNSVSQDDYLDVIEERNILLLCGYPLCPVELKPIKKKYHISLKTNKVYDITERKCFCSNICYKASNFLKAQLCTSPVWLKDKDADDEPIKLLSTTQNGGSAGEEVDFGHLRMTVDDIECVPDKSSENLSENSYSPHLSDELETCATKLEELKIAERCTYSLNTDTLESTLLISEEKGQDDEVGFSVVKDGDNISVIKETYVEKENSPEQFVRKCRLLDSDDDEDCNKLLIGYEESESLISNNKYMPMIPKAKVRKALLIDPIGNPDDTSRLASATEKTSSSLELIKRTLMTWITIKTYRLLLGEKIDTLKEDILKRVGTVPTSALQANNVDKLKRMKESYTKMCLKLEKEEAIELNGHSVENNAEENLCRDKVQGEALSESKDALEHRKVSIYKGGIGLPEKNPTVHKKKPGKKPKPTPGKGIKKDSSGKIPTRMKEMQEPVVISTSREVNVLPPVESLSKNTIRRQIVADHLKIVYWSILPLIGLHYHDICEDFRLLISTFSLSSTNITFKPLEWKMIAVILFRMIEKKLTTEKVWAQENCWQLLEAKLTSFNISLDQIESLLASVMDHSHFKNLVLGY